MGRGRAKAKQTKVARALKYYSPDTNLSALEQELHGSTANRTGSRLDDTDGDLRYEDDDDYRSWGSGRG
ncbi:conserved hypothetical protein [Nostocoides japonicum T1-X7]|uniref:DUF3073 domain-containing protein n=1 Tax=Nostocoides japonicum T1-X7 TaxID=1194083 RepID=A0A077LV41_9MICO|nr:DUF3073 domain-containing protein [Tetrasphaera japonica]CCH75889.1 conserved hypothetical protein [Tetrasphaera japonica T1-X7]